MSKLTGLYAPAETVRHSRRGHFPPARRGVPRAVAAPSPLLVSKSTAVDPAATWVLHPRRDRHIGSLLVPGRVCAIRVSYYICTTLALAGPAEPRGVHREARAAAHQHHHTRHTLAPGTLAAQTSALHWHEFRFRSVRTWASRLRAQRCSCSSSTRWGIFSAQMRLCPSCHSSPS